MKTSKLQAYRRIIITLSKELLSGNYEDFSCGNTMGLHVRNPYKCIDAIKRFNKLEKKGKS